MFCDDSAALLIANEPGVQMGARHYHRSNLLKVHTDDNLAYPFTKALPKGKLTQHARSMGLRLASSFIKKQATLSKSSIEAEYRSMASVTCELEANSVFHEKSKHFEIDVHLVKEKVYVGVIKTTKIHTDLQIADIFTKCLGVVQHELFCSMLGMLDVFVGKKASVAGNKSRTFSLRENAQELKSSDNQTKSERLKLSKNQSCCVKGKYQAQYDKSSKCKV
ncbi:hypothetical protein Tco_0472825, partial [Tanacetum coccineum]